MHLIMYELRMQSGDLTYLPQMAYRDESPRCFICANIDQSLHAFSSRDNAFKFMLQHGVAYDKLFELALDLRSISEYVEGKRISSHEEIENIEAFRLLVYDLISDWEVEWERADFGNSEIFQMFVLRDRNGLAENLPRLAEIVNHDDIRSHVEVLYDEFSTRLVIDKYTCS